MTECIQQNITFRQTLFKFIFIVCVIFIIDQAIKLFFIYHCNAIEGCYLWQSKFFSLVLVFNKGVAFSLFSFLGSYLKLLQFVCILILFIFIVKNRVFFIHFTTAISLIFAGGVSNLFDRFIHEGVVDYIYWHYYFNFAIFNLADVVINIGVGVFLIQFFYKKFKK